MKKLLHLFISIILFSINSIFVNAYGVPQNGLIGEAVFSASGATVKNMSVTSSYPSYINYYNKIGSNPGGYINNGTSSYYITYSPVGINNEDVKMLSFWYSYASVGSSYSNFIFQNNYLTIQAFSNSLDIFYLNEKIGTIPSIPSGWNMISLYIQNGKLNILINGTQKQYSYTIDKEVLLSQKSFYSNIANMSNIRLYDRILNSAELSDIYSETSNNGKATITPTSTTFNFTDNEPVYNLDLGKVTDTYGLVSVVYSLNGSAFKVIDGMENLQNPSQVPINLSLVPNNIPYGQNKLEVKAFDSFLYSDISTYYVNKRKPTPDVASGTLIGNFYFFGNLTSSTGSFSFTSGSPSYKLGTKNSFNYVSITNSAYPLSLSSPDTNIKTMSFWHRGNGDFFDNGYLKISYTNNKGYSFSRLGNLLISDFGPKDSNQWHFVTLALDPTNQMLKIDIDGGAHKTILSYYKTTFSGITFKVGDYALINMYSKVLSDEEISDLYNFYKNTPPEIITNSSIFTIDTTDEYLTIPLVVNDPDPFQIVEYYYSTDNINYTKLSNSTQAPANDFLLELDISADVFNEGNNSLYIKANDEINDSNILDLSIFKKLKKFDININEAGLSFLTNKYIKASVTAGELYYSITRDDTCDESLWFEEYTGDLYFTNENDNGIKVCFKGIYDNEELYKLSSEVKGIGSKTTSVKNSNIFQDFENWYKNSEIKDYDPIYVLISSQVSSSVTGNMTPTYNYPKIITDVNGDGLPDLIITSYSSQYNILLSGGQYTRFYALLLNKGNLDYDIKYRCVYVTGSTMVGYPAPGYYGDCAK